MSAKAAINMFSFQCIPVVFDLVQIYDACHVERGAKNFSSSIATCLQSVGHSMPHDSGVIPIMEVDAMIEALNRQLQGTHSHTLHCPRAAPSAGVVSCTLRRRYCQLPVSGRRLQRFLQFRLGSHNLPVVAGWFCCIARADRVCTQCGEYNRGINHALLLLMNYTS